MKLTREEFVDLLSANLTKGSEEEVSRPFFFFFFFVRHTFFHIFDFTNFKYNELFDNIDVIQSGSVDWDKFASYMLMLLYESDDRVRAFSIPNWRPVRNIHKCLADSFLSQQLSSLKAMFSKLIVSFKYSTHRDSIRRIEFIRNLNRYITISRVCSNEFS